MTFTIVSDEQKQSNQTPIPEPLLNVEELAAALNVPKSWVYARTRETGPGCMPRLAVGKYRRFRLLDVLAWLEKQNEVN